MAESQDLLSLLIGELHTLAKFLSCPEGSSDEQPQNNPNYIQGKKSNRLLRDWIICSLSEEGLGLVIGSETKTQVWQALKDAYAQSSQKP